MHISRINISALLPALASNATILVPNHRIRDAIVTDYANSHHDSVFKSPRVFAIDVWIRNLWDLGAHSGLKPFADWQLLNSVQEHFIWTAVIEESLSELPLLNPEDTASAVNQSYRDLKQWLPGNSLERLQQAGANPDVGAFVQWIKSYQRRSAKLQVINLVDAIEIMLVEKGAALHGLPFLPAEICLVNFHEPPPLYRNLFAQLAAVTAVTELSLHEATTPARMRHVFSDQAAELAACAHWAKTLKSTTPDAHIGIVCSADILAQPVLRQQLITSLSDVPDLGSNAGSTLFNSSGSRQHILETGLVHDALLLLNLVNPQQSSNDLSRLLQSPYLLAAAAEKEARLQMEVQMRRYFAATTSMTDFSWHLQQTERPTHAPLLAAALLNSRTRLRQFPGSALAQEWAIHFSGWLTDFGWPGAQLSPADLKLYAQWQEALRAFAGASVVLGKLNLGSAIARLKTLCTQQALATAFHANNPLSIYSVVEAIGLQFEHVWLLGFSDRTWPPAAHPSPFIPYALQLEAQIPGCHSDVQLQRASRQFALLGTSVTQQLIASHYHADGELEYSPSSFISSWPEQALTALQATGVSPQSLPAVTADALETVADLAAFPMQDSETVRGGQSIISNQSSCPFRAFAKHRLQVEPLARFEAGLSMRDRGSALHAALQLLFSHIDGLAALQALTADSRSELVAQAAAHAINFLDRHHRDLMTPRFRQLEQQRITALLQRFLELESGRHSFQVLAREAALSWQHEKLQLRLQIDRIDVLADNSLALIDYKTGKRAVNSKSWLEARPEDMQLPLYYTVAADSQQQPIAALVIAHVNVEKIAYSGLVAAANVHANLKPVTAIPGIATEWSALAEGWQHMVRLRAEEFVDGLAQVSPVHGRSTCEYCGLQALCRIQELDSTMPDDDSETETEA